MHRELKIHGEGILTLLYSPSPLIHNKKDCTRLHVVAESSGSRSEAEIFAYIVSGLAYPWEKKGLGNNMFKKRWLACLQGWALFSRVGELSRINIFSRMNFFFKGGDELMCPQECVYFQGWTAIFKDERVFSRMTLFSGDCCILINSKFYSRVYD